MLSVGSQSTLHKIIGQGWNVDKKARVNLPQGVKLLGEQEKGVIKGKGKGKETAKEAINVLSIVDVWELIVTSWELINFSCYKPKELVEWLLDSSCTKHVTPAKSDFIEYREFDEKGTAKITDGKYRVWEWWLDRV